MAEIKHHDLVIPTDGSDPFVNCKLDRKQYAEILSNMIQSYSNGFVLALNNEWGAGKTTFVNMWRQQLINEGIRTLYFNAWENDFQDDVMIALLSELKELQTTQQKFEDILSKSGVFLSKIAPSVIKGVTSKLVGDEAVADVIKAATQFTTGEVEEYIKAYNKKKKGFTAFRESLEDYVKSEDSNTPVVFFVDELDRCKPDYAVKVMEQIKHLFSVKGIVFVLSIDKQQLGHSIQGFYGSANIDSNQYLKRFIDLEFSLPKPDPKNYIEYLLDYYKFDEFTESDLRIYNRRELGDEKRRISEFANDFFFTGNFSLRQIDKILVRIRLTLNTFPDNYYIYPNVLLFIAYLNEIDIIIYNKIFQLQYDLKEFAEALGGILKPMINQANKDMMVYLEAALLCMYENYYKSINTETNQSYMEHTSGVNKLTYRNQITRHNDQLRRILISTKNDRQFNRVKLGNLMKRYNLVKAQVSEE